MKKVRARGVRYAAVAAAGGKVELSMRKKEEKE